MQNEAVVGKVGVDTAEDEPRKKPVLSSFLPSRIDRSTKLTYPSCNVRVAAPAVELAAEPALRSLPCCCWSGSHVHVDDFLAHDVGCVIMRAYDDASLDLDSRLSP